MDHRQLISELYQILGALDAPENVLNQVAAADAGQPLPHETLLPFVGESRAALLQPVAYMTYKGHLLHAANPKVKEHSNPTPLFDFPPVSRDVLMALAAEVRNEVCRAATEIMGVEWFYVDGDLAAIADRYASKEQLRVRIQSESQLAAVEHARASHQKFIEETGIDHVALAASGFDANSGVPVQPEPVNQQLLAALKALIDMDVAYQRGEKVERAVEVARDAIAAAEAAQPVAQQYLLGGRRFKVTHSQDHGFAITGLPQTMNGQWVAFVDATDNCHMQQQQPASAQPVAVPDVLEQLQLAETEVTNAKAWSAGEQAKTHCKYALTAIAVARSMLSAGQKGGYA